MNKQKNNIGFWWFLVVILSSLSMIGTFLIIYVVYRFFIALGHVWGI